MIHPEAYDAAHRSAPSPESLGRLGFALVGREGELSPPLTPAERWQVDVIAKCDELDAERNEADADMKRKRAAAAANARWSRARRAAKSAASSAASSDGASNGASDGEKPAEAPVAVEAKPVVVALKPTALGGLFARALAEDADNGGGAFFDPRFDPVVICSAVSGDYHSVARWRGLVRAKGEAAVREEAFSFWRELAAGEKVRCRGAALNARLARLPDAKPA